MNGGQVRRQLAQNRNRRGLVVDEHPSLSAGCNLAPQDYRFIFLVDAVVLQDLRDRLFGSAFNFEDGRNRGLVRTGANYVRGGFVSKKKGQCIDENGFSGAGFAGQKVKPGANSTTRLSTTA